jgi:serine O-acetyltransferase
MSKESFILSQFEKLGLLGSDPPDAMVVYRAARKEYLAGNLELATKYQRLNKILNNCVIPFSCSIGAGTKTAYGGIAILIHRNASIGCYCSIGARVTIGGTRTGVPVIEDNVFIATGACILGGVKVSTGTIVGANAVITRDTDPFGVYVGAPSRKASTVTCNNIGRYQTYYGIKDMNMMKEFLRLHAGLMNVDA